MVSPAKEFKPGSVGWTVDDIDNDPEVRWRWETSRWELIDGVVVAPGFGPGVATRLVPGSSGWTVTDLRKSSFRHQWEAGRYELVNGVITEMSPPAFSHGFPIGRLIGFLHAHFATRDFDHVIAPEVDIHISETRYFTPDAVVLTLDQVEQQRRVERELIQHGGWMAGLQSPPLLAIESISPGYARHDLNTKKNAYADFGIKHYWVIDATKRELYCFELIDREYHRQQDAVKDGAFQPATFPGFTCPIHQLFL